MSAFARLAGDWQVKLTSGVASRLSWQWGPGKHSIRKIAENSDAPGKPWGMEIMYWHPGPDQLRVLNIHADIPGVGRGIGEGTVTFDGDKGEVLMDLVQSRGPRKMASRWVFHAPDRYHDSLLEDGGSGFQPLADWMFTREDRRPEPPPAHAPLAPPATLPGSLKPLEPLIDAALEAEFQTGTGAARTRTTFTWLPSLQIVHACARLSGGETPEACHVLDAFIYRDLRTGLMRCLALSSAGGVYEGDLAPGDDSTGFQFNLKGYEGDRVIPYTARIDVRSEPRHHTRIRLWSGAGDDRVLRLDIAPATHPPRPE